MYKFNSRISIFTSDGSNTLNNTFSSHFVKQPTVIRNILYVSRQQVPESMKTDRISTAMSLVINMLQGPNPQLSSVKVL